MSGVLQVLGLTTVLDLPGGAAPVVDDVSFSVDPGETLAIVGESGCGKTMTALSVLRILPEPSARVVAGRLLLDGRDLLRLSESEMRRVRGNEIAMIFQDPMTSLNPVLTIGEQIGEGLLAHCDISRRESRLRAIDLLRRVRIPDPEARLGDYPHRLSGGMRQRVMIASALACRPKVLIADEPTTALDVSIQGQILDLLKELQEESGTSIILITHNLGVVAEMAQRVLVMYAGRVVEDAAVGDLFHRPKHPYTQGLLGATPRFDAEGGGRLSEIPGMVPPITDLPQGCAFAPRCPRKEPACESVRPRLSPLPGGRHAACFVAQREGAG